MKKGNKWRRRIIRLLENLLEDLQSRPPGPTQSEVINKLAALSDRADSIMNGVEDTDIAGSLYYSKSIPIPGTEEIVVYKLKDCLEDTAFAVYCCIQDATYVRLFSARAWREFGLSSIGIQTATFCTNSAYAQLGRMSEQLRRIFDHNTNDNWMTRMHSKINSFMRRHVANDMERTDTQPDKVNPVFEDVSLARNRGRRLGFYASTLLCSRLVTLLHEALILRQRLHPADTLEETRLLKSLAQLRCLEWCSDPISETLKTDCMYEAALSLHLGHMDTDAVFAAQMLFDIQQEVDPQIYPLEDILEALSLDYLRRYERYSIQWMTKIPDDDLFSNIRRIYNQFGLLRHIVHSESDIQVDLEKLEYATPRQHAIQDFNIVRHVPTLIGQMVTQHHEEFHGAFLSLASDRGHILTALHLYNAAKLCKSLPPGIRWADMEWVIDSQVDVDRLGKSPENNGSGLLRNFCEAYGFDHRTFMTGSRPPHLERLRDNIHLPGRFPRRLKGFTKHIRARTEFRNSHGSKPGEWRIRLMQAFADYELDAFSAHGSPHSIGLLIAAKEICESDEEALHFDLFAFHTTCFNLLWSIRKACFENAPNDYSDIRHDGMMGINTAIADLMRDMLLLPRNHPPMWSWAMKLLTDVITQKGSACEDGAFERIKMTTLESIGVGSDDRRSGTTSAGSARTAATSPLPEFMEIDEPGNEERRSGSPAVEPSESDEGFHPQVKKMEISPEVDPSAGNDKVASRVKNGGDGEAGQDSVVSSEEARPDPARPLLPQTSTK